MHLAGSPRTIRLLQTFAFVVLCALASVFFVSKVNSIYPVRSWLFWHLASVWEWEALLHVACVSFGYTVLTRGLRVRHLPPLETLVVSMALGLVSFVALMFAAGALHLFRPWFAVALPAALVLIGVPAALPLLRALPMQLRSLDLKLRPTTALSLCAALVALALLYLQVMTPDGLGCDAKWFHVTVAQDYAREGRIVPFMADWAKNLPQFTSVLHTWAFLVPGMTEPVRWIMVLHTEFTLYVWTLVALVPAVRWVTTTQTGSGSAFATFLLFPSVFIYDSNLSGAADHVTAFFALPLLLCGLRAAELPEPRMAAAAGAMAGAALLTKYQAVYMIAPLALLLVARASVGILRPVTLRGISWRQAWLTCAAFGASALLVFSPHLIKNQLFHHNPVYPFLMETIGSSTPVVPGGAKLFNDHLAHIGTGPLWPRLMDALRLVFTFAFEFPADHLSSKGPFMGALFSLLLPLVLLFRQPRLWAASGVAVAALVAWAIGFPTPRNVETFLPVLMAVAASIIALSWKKGWTPRIAIAVVIALQLVWGGDEVFLSGSGRIASSMDLVRAGAEKRTETRLKRYRADFRAFGQALPGDAVVLLHTTYEQLGINRRTLLDWPGFQGLIDYRPMRNARDVYDRLRQVGVTHIATDPAWPAHSRQEEVVFDSFLYRYTKSRGQVGPFKLWDMPDTPPPAEHSYSVLCIGIRSYPDGLYPVERLDNLDEDAQQPRTPQIALTDAAQAVELAQISDAVLVSTQAKQNSSLSTELAAHFSRPVAYPAYAVHLRRTPASLASTRIR